MNVITHEKQAVEDWRPGVATRMLVSAQTRAAQLCVFEQFCDPGLGAPVHMHAVEEVLTVLAGEAEITVGGETLTAGAGHSVIIPAGVMHGFRNIAASGRLHMHAILASPIFEASYEDKREQTRRYVPRT